MKNFSIRILKVVIVLIGICTLSFLLWEPHVEGRNANATLLQIYFNDPFLAYVYVASIPFFIALYQVTKALEYVKKNEILALKELHRAKKYVVFVISSIAVGEIFILLNSSDDRAGGVFMGILTTLFLILIILAITRLEQKIQQEK